jgi:hypothetical protein
LYVHIHAAEAYLEFISKIGCPDAILTASSVNTYFTSRGATMSLCSLDLSKAFDRVNHYKLSSTLMDRNIPKSFIEVMCDWTTRRSAVVRWEYARSSAFIVSNGVRRHGGTISPTSFALYVDVLIHPMMKKKLDCSITHKYGGCIVYADHILLSSTSVTELQIIPNVWA